MVKALIAALTALADICPEDDTKVCLALLASFVHEGGECRHELAALAEQLEKLSKKSDPKLTAKAREALHARYHELAEKRLADARAQLEGPARREEALAGKPDPAETEKEAEEAAT